MSSFVERLTYLKKSKNMLQKDIAKNCNISLRTYQRYEYGEREPSMSILVTLSNYFNVSIDYLVGRTDKPEINK